MLHTTVELLGLLWNMTEVVPSRKVYYITAKVCNLIWCEENWDNEPTYSIQMDGNGIGTRETYRAFHGQIERRYQEELRAWLARI